jgi:hypothetical protein
MTMAPGAFSSQWHLVNETPYRLATGTSLAVENFLLLYGEVSGSRD